MKNDVRAAPRFRIAAWVMAAIQTSTLFACGGGLAVDQRDGAISDATDSGTVDLGTTRRDGAVLDDLCPAFDAIWGGTRCERCVAEANRAGCEMLWNRIGEECSASYLCAAAHCGCDGGDTCPGACACVLSCLPLGPSHCGGLWREATSCIQRYCNGRC